MPIDDSRKLLIAKKLFEASEFGLDNAKALEYNVDESIKTNILGTQNIIDASINLDVKKVLMISSDKAVSPVNLYGATKLVAEKILRDNPKVVEEYRTGKESPLQFFIGQGMKETKGSVNPEMLKEIILELLKNQK